MALMQDIVHEKAVAAFGLESQWTDEQRAAYRAAVMEKQYQAGRELEQDRARQALQLQQNAAVAAATIGNGLKSAGDSIAGAQTDPFLLQKMKANQQGSATFMPDAPGSQWGTIWGPNGAQRVEKTSDGGFRIWQ
jgi:hypothetical protein